MYGTVASVLYRSIGSEGWLCQLHKDQNIHTLEWCLLYEYVKTDLYERQLKLGMLSPYAESFYPLTEKVLCEVDTTEKTNEEIDKKESGKQIETIKQKDTPKKQDINSTPEKPQEKKNITE